MANRGDTLVKSVGRSKLASDGRVVQQSAAENNLSNAIMFDRMQHDWLSDKTSPDRWNGEVRHRLGRCTRRFGVVPGNHADRRFELVVFEDEEHHTDSAAQSQNYRDRVRLAGHWIYEARTR